MLNRPYIQLVTLLTVLPLLAVSLTIPHIYARDSSLGDSTSTVVPRRLADVTERRADDVVAAAAEGTADDAGSSDDDDSSLERGLLSPPSCNEGLLGGILSSVFGGGHRCRESPLHSAPPAYAYHPGGSYPGGSYPGYPPAYNPYSRHR